MSIRLIDVKTLRLKSFNSQNAPSYAVLSHTWVEDEEVSFQEMCQIAQEPSHTVTRKSGYRKIWETCRVSLAYGLNYAWVDTCCIDKSSSAELSEAINSMFRWYRDAQVCFAYLSDYHFLGANEEKMEECKWFTRGWCLQELIAPKHLIFYNQTWKALGSRHDLQGLVASITRIDHDVLEDHTVMYSLPIARRMSWASTRITTRVEDIAYCLLGIFDINMPMLYGEGEKAFVRLQEEITRRFNDTSIFLFSPKVPPASGFLSSPETKQKWAEGGTRLQKGPYEDSQFSATDYLHEVSSYEFCSMFANSPADFHACGDVVRKRDSRASFDRQAFSVTNRGVQLGKQILWCNWGKHCFMWETAFRHSDVIRHNDIDGVIFLRQIGRNLFARVLLPLQEIMVARSTLHEDVCVLLHMTPSIHRQIFKTLKTILRIDVKDCTGSSVSFSQQKPMDVWDESGKLFLCPENYFSSTSSMTGDTFTRSIYLTVEGERVRGTRFCLHFLVKYRRDMGADGYVLISEAKTTKSRKSDVEGEDPIESDLMVTQRPGSWSARSRHFFGRMSVHAHIYREPVLELGFQVFTCSVDIDGIQT